MNNRELKWLRFLQATAKYLACSPHVLIGPTIEQSLIHLKKKNLIVFPSVWSDDMDIETVETFQNSHLGGIYQKNISFWPAVALAKNWC